MPAMVMPSVARQTRPQDYDLESRLMLRVQRDEPGAFSELEAQFRGRIYSQVDRVVQDRQEAEDLTQEVLLRVYRARKRYQPRAKFSTWLFHITQNVARNALRSRSRRRALHFRMLGAAAFEHSERSRRSVAERDPLESSELAQVVRSAVGELVGRQRTAFEMQQFQTRSYNDIARALALTPKATKSLLYRARIHLRDLLSPYVFGP